MRISTTAGSHCRLAKQSSGVAEQPVELIASFIAMTARCGVV